MRHQAKTSLIAAVSALGLMASADMAAAGQTGGAESWNGLYFGGNLGYGDANFGGIFDNTDGGADLSKLNAGGFIGGVHVGFNRVIKSNASGAPYSGILIGIEGDLTFGDMDDKENVIITPQDFIRAEIDMLASIRARLGVIFDPLMVFVTGGVAFNSGEYFGLDGNVPLGQTVNFSNTGGVVGGGVEFAAFDFAILRLEGLYYFFGDKKDFNNLAGTGEVGDFGKMENVFVVRAGVSIPLSKLFGAMN